MPLLKTYLTKFTLVILALQILNLSIYNTNFYSGNFFRSTKAQLKDINPIDSFAELMLEDVAGYPNAFPEPTHKNNKQSGELKQNTSFNLFHQDHFPEIKEKAIVYEAASDLELPIFCNNYSYLFWEEINHPPS